MFGGIKPKSKASDSNLYILSLGEKEHQWKIVKASGSAPQARSHHTMHFLEAANLLVVVGGLRVAESSVCQPEKMKTKIIKHWSDLILADSEG